VIIEKTFLKFAMTDPVTLTASAIAALAFQEFVKSGAGELAKKFTTEAIAKMGQLRKLIWDQLRGNPDAKTAMANVEQGQEGDLTDIGTYLKAAMSKDSEFASQVQAIAQEINAGKLLDQSSMTQNNYDNAKGWQTKVEGGTAYVGEIHIQGQDKQS
jgi:hypothetical protein